MAEITFLGADSAGISSECYMWYRLRAEIDGQEYAIATQLSKELITAPDFAEVVKGITIRKAAALHEQLSKSQ